MDHLVEFVAGRRKKKGGFSAGLAGKNLSANAGDTGSVPGWGRSPGERKGNPLQSSCLETPTRQRSLAGYSPWGHKVLDMTEATENACKGKKEE